MSLQPKMRLTLPAAVVSAAAAVAGSCSSARCADGSVAHKLKVLKNCRLCDFQTHIEPPFAFFVQKRKGEENSAPGGLPAPR